MINNTPPIDFLILFQNTTGFIAYLLAGGHLTTKSFEMIENYITDVNQKNQMIEFIYYKYAQNKYSDVIYFSNQRIQKLPLNDCLSYVLTNDIETTTKLLPKFKDDSELLNKLLYYAILDSNKNQAELLLKTFYNNSSKKQINAIPSVLQNENFNDNFGTPLMPSANNNVFKMLSSIEPIYTREQFMSPLQYTIASSTDIPLCETERLEKRCIIIDCLYQTQDNSTLDAQSYTKE